MTSLRHWPAAWREWLLAYDPALAHVRRTMRATAATAIALAAASQLAEIAGKPPTIALLGSVVALLASMLVQDPTRGAQTITIALMALSAAVTTVIATLVAPMRLLGDGVFVLVVFAAVYLRRVGTRGFALGMAGFIPYFLNLLLSLKPATLPWTLLCVAIGAASAALMRFVVLPDRPRRELRHTLRAVRANAGQVLDTTLGAIDTGRWTRWRRHQLQRRVLRLNATVLAAESQLDTAAAVHVRTDMTPREFRARLFALELAVERVATVASRGKPTEVAAERAELVRLRRVTASDVLDDPADERPPSTRLARPLRSLRAALQALPAAASVRVDPGGPQADTGAAAGSGSSRMRPSTRQAIQVTVASAAAIGAGEMISPHRWYWAVIAAFVVFNGTSTRGETLVKGWQRLLGTVGGVIAGVFIATAVNGDTDLSIALIFACIFLAFYSIRGAYGIFIFWLTILLALLYGLLGHFTPELLVLRLEETALGAAIGVLVATFLLPASSRGAYEQARGDCLRALADSIGACIGRIVDKDSDGEPLPAARELDRRVHQVQAKAQPFTSTLPGVRRRNGVPEEIRDLVAAAYYSRDLAHLSVQVKPADDLARAMHAAGRAIMHNACMLADGDISIESAAHALERLNRLVPEPSTSETRRQARVFRLLGWIDRLLIRLARGQR